MTDPSAAQSPVVPSCYRHAGRETYIRCQRCERPICPDCMRQASVGFHCPECVREAAKSVRAPRTVGGGLVPGRSGVVSTILIAMNVVVFLAIRAPGGVGDRIANDGAMWTRVPAFLTDVAPGVVDGGVWRLLTSAFIHYAILHILFNMYAIWLFGPLLEKMLGYVRFIALYVTTAVAGSVAVLWLAGPATPTIGASTAVFGLFGAAIVLLHKQRQDITSLLVLLAINVVLSFTLSEVSWQGHLGGLASGLVLGAAFAYAPKARRNIIQIATFALIWVALIGLTLARTTMFS